MSTFWIEILSKLGEIFSTNNRLIDWSHNFLLLRASHSRILYIPTKNSLKNFSIVEKGTSEGTDYWIIQNWPWKTSRKKDFSEKGLAEKVNSVKHTVVDQSHTL